MYYILAVKCVMSHQIRKIDSVFMLGLEMWYDFIWILIKDCLWNVREFAVMI